MTGGAEMESGLIVDVWPLTDFKPCPHFASHLDKLKRNPKHTLSAFKMMFMQTLTLVVLESLPLTTIKTRATHPSFYQGKAAGFGTCPVVPTDPHYVNNKLFHNLLICCDVISFNIWTRLRWWYHTDSTSTGQATKQEPRGMVRIVKTLGRHCKWTPVEPSSDLWEGERSRILLLLPEGIAPEGRSIGNRKQCPQKARRNKSPLPPILGFSRDSESIGCVYVCINRIKLAHVVQNSLSVPAGWRSRRAHIPVPPKGCFR